MPKTRYLAFLIAQVLLSFNCVSQNTFQSEIDSLTLLSKDTRRADTLRAQDYVTLSTYYFRQNIDTVVAICYEGLGFIHATSYAEEDPEFRPLELSKSNLLMNIGFTYYYLNQLDRSIEAFYQSLKIAEKYDDKKAIADVRTNIANVEIDLGEMESAVVNLHIVLGIQEEIGDLQGKSRTLNTMGYIHRVSGDNDLALSYYEKALIIRIETGNRIGMAACYNNMAFIYRDDEEFDKAIANYRLAIEIYEQEDELTGIAVIYGNLANCYLEIGEFSRACNYAEKGYSLAKNQGSIKDMMYLTEVLYQAFKSRGDYKTSLQYYEEHTGYKDSLTQDKHYKELINQELDYEYAEKEKLLKLENDQKIELKELEHSNEIELSKEQNRRLYVVLGLSLLVLIVVSIFLYYIFRQKKIIEAQGKELELVALRTQMNPHFLFNSLNSIKHFIIENEKDLSTRYVTRFSKLVRLVLENSNKNLISLENELETTRYYLELEQIRFRNKFDFTIDTRADALIELPPLVLQPYVENAIWHGLLYKEEKGMVSITTSENEAGVLIEIRDNGVGRVKSAEMNSSRDYKKSMGMNITQKRIQSLNEILGIQPTVEIQDLYDNNEPAGTLVKILIPFHA